MCAKFNPQMGADYTTERKAWKSQPMNEVIFMYFATETMEEET
jgi:hypothetical protein